MGGGRRFRRWYLQTRKDGGGVDCAANGKKWESVRHITNGGAFYKNFSEYWWDPRPKILALTFSTAQPPLFLYIYITFFNLFLYYSSRFQPPIPYLKKRVHCNGSHLPHHFSFSFQNYPCHILGITIQYSIHINMFLP